jgi:hypothetical protein
LRLLVVISSQYLPRKRAAHSPDILAITSWSAFEIFFQVASFITSAKLVLYRPPGIRGAVLDRAFPA